MDRKGPAPEKRPEKLSRGLREDAGLVGNAQSRGNISGVIPEKLLLTIRRRGFILQAVLQIARCGRRESTMVRVTGMSSSYYYFAAQYVGRYFGIPFEHRDGTADHR